MVFWYVLSQNFSSKSSLFLSSMLYVNLKKVGSDPPPSGLNVVVFISDTDIHAPLKIRLIWKIMWRRLWARSVRASPECWVLGVLGGIERTSKDLWSYVSQEKRSEMSYSITRLSLVCTWEYTKKMYNVWFREMYIVHFSESDYWGERDAEAIGSWVEKEEGVELGKSSSSEWEVGRWRRSLRIKVTAEWGPINRGVTVELNFLSFNLKRFTTAT